MNDEMDYAEAVGLGSLLRRHVGEMRWGLAVVRATVLEAAHPQVGAALAEHSTFLAHPWRRLSNTLGSVHRLVEGDAPVRDREAARLSRLHARIAGTDPQGRAYSGTDPEARAWVVATLFESTVTMRKLNGHAMSAGEEERLYAEFRSFLAFLEKPDGQNGQGGPGGQEARLPASLQEFWSYYDTMLAQGLESNESVHAILYRLFAEVPAPPFLRDHPALWAAIRAVVGPTATAITVASLPESYRRQAGLAPPPGAGLVMHGAYLVAGIATRVLPDAWTRGDLITGFLDPRRADSADRHGSASRPFGAVLHHAGNARPLLHHLAKSGALQSQAQRTGSALLQAMSRTLQHDPSGHGGDAAAVRSAERFFSEVLDQTGNGLLSWPDLAAMAREIATRLDLDEEPERLLFAAFGDWWRELLAALDTDGDGVVTRHEYAAGASAVTGPALVRAAEILFRTADADGDGTISAEEFRTLFSTGFDQKLAATGEGLSRSAFTSEFINFMSGRHRSTAYDGLLTNA
ncbi:MULTISPECIES: oxygenase MpaB family protein [Actinomadura]|uniref:Oxygenase MpaB family protein n=2 Tax=Actinomadura yumaensis TaxID=111807 RepID=A0ABW2CX73_9ACTN|nr:oxygenase MpaB family protein [Actinomadura sp. J1-007]MWK32643.1 DUF2236 domain-containing protein [Actinomadura sp. J1-007]